MRLLSVFLIALFLYPPSAISNSSFLGDANVLISLRAAMVVPNHLLDSWRPSNYTTHCSWTGVQCDHMDRVVALNLCSMKISGSFPSQVTDLPALRVLNVSDNILDGSLPSNISKLRNLEVLDVSYNNLSGVLPLDLSYLVKLNHLDLEENQFSGSIPSEYRKLVNVEYLSLAANSLSGRIPAELGKLENLKTLFLWSNAFSGGIPPEIGNLSKLVYLDISACALSGAIPSQLGGLKNLETMYLSDNGLTGPIPPQLGHLVSLKYMDLSYNNLSGEIPVELSELKELRKLSLSYNRLSGEIPVELSELKEFRGLYLSNNRLSGEIPVELSELKELTALALSNNRLHGGIPSFIGDLPNLEYLVLGQNNFTGLVPQQLGVSGKLVWVNVSSNRLTGSIPPNLCGGGTLEYIDISQNEFSGPIPVGICGCGTLEYIDISQNELSGPIPVEITRMSTLYYLNVSRNHLNGSIPRELENIQTWLSMPDFSYNNFSGFLQEGNLFSYLDSKYFVGNPYLCGPKLNACLSHVNGSPLKGHIKIGLVLAPVLFFWLLVLGIGVVIIKARVVKKEDDGRCWKMTAFQKLNFGSDDILECIKEENVIGKGGAGVVYRGIMPNGEHVAVKKLLGSRKDSSNDHGFSAEMEILGRIRHRHIVRLMAICSNHETNLLVYEYMTNGSLGELLHGSNSRHLQWHTRYKIALEAAKGLCYLHHDCRPLIIHRDVKSNNILLDSNFETHVADFGLAKFLYHSGALESMSSIAGSFGYIAPEYAYTLKVNEKSDVYSYGVVLLELITGKKSVGECEFEEDMNMVGWVKKLTNSAKERVWMIIDPKLNSVPVEEAMHLFLVALLCVQEHPHHRPTMRDIVHILTYFPTTEPM